MSTKYEKNENTSVNESSYVDKKSKNSSFYFLVECCPGYFNWKRYQFSTCKPTWQGQQVMGM